MRHHLWLMLAIAMATGSAFAQQTALDSTVFIKGFNWGPSDTLGLEAARDLFHCNVEHNGVQDYGGHEVDSLAARARRYKQKLILAYTDSANSKFHRGGWNVSGLTLYQNTVDCERMTFWGGAPTNEKYLNVFCFRKTNAVFAGTRNLDTSNPYVEFSAGSPDTLRSSQFGRDQWYEEHVDSGANMIYRDTTLYLTLVAQRESDTTSGHGHDTVFTVTIHRGNADSLKCCSTCGLSDKDDTTFYFTTNQFRRDPFVDSVTFSFPWKHIHQTSPYGDYDSTEVLVAFTGACAMRLYWTRLEDSTAHEYFALSDTGAAYQNVLHALKYVEDKFDTTLFRLYDNDEGPPSLDEALARHRQWLVRAADSLARVSASGYFRVPVASEMRGDFARSFQGIVQSPETWIGLGIGDALSAAAQVDTGKADLAGVPLAAHHGFQHGYKWYYAHSGAWNTWASYELGSAGIQADLGAMDSLHLMHGAATRLAGGRWWANPFVHGTWNFSDSLWNDARTATAVVNFPPRESWSYCVSFG